MKTLSLPFKLIKSPFENFSLVKQKILPLFTPSNSPTDAISELDWDNGNDFNRPWVKEILPSLSYNLMKLLKTQNYSSISFQSIWYQKYLNNSYHTWHTHGGHYTGVLYLNFPKNSPLTQLFINNEIIDVEAQEGDIIVFPSMVPHRSPPNLSKDPKIIISFNLDIYADYTFLPR